MAGIPTKPHYLKSPTPRIQNFTSDFKYGRSPTHNFNTSSSSECGWL